MISLIDLTPFRQWNAELEKTLEQKLQEELARKETQGLLITTSGIQGMSYDEVLAMKEPSEILTSIVRTQTLFRTLENSGKPVAIAISGPLLGRGLELALACHYRVMIDSPTVKLGFPDIQFGLVSGAGGVQRLVRKVGLQAAIPFLLMGQKIDAKMAAQMGLVERVVGEGELLSEAKQWLLSKPEALQPWDKKGFRLPGGEVYTPKNQQFWMVTNANLRKQTWGHFMGRDLALSSLYEGAQVAFNRATEIEAEYFVRAAKSDAFKSSVKTLFYVKQKADKLSRRPAGIPTKKIETIGILGAGMMGAGIALVAAMRGIKVVLLDMNQEIAEQGKAYTATFYDKQIAQGKATPEQKQTILNRIVATESYEALKPCDFVIEAVIEDRKVKAQVTRKAEEQVSTDARIASNTSTLPITGLAKPLSRPERMIGLHFFSPVERMPLLEIIVGEKTDKTTVAWSLDFAKQMGKTPIVVNDGRGFFTSRVFEKYVLEGITLLQEGVQPALIEHAARLAGMPVGPLALADEVSLSLISQILKQTREDLGSAWEPHPAEEVVERFVSQLKRLGKKVGKGFYEYPQSGKKVLWSELSKIYPVASEQPDLKLLQYRLLFIQSLEAVRCMEEGIITDPSGADLGSILGLGFPAFTGGVISYLKQLGRAKSLEICEQLEKKWGKRFHAPSGLNTIT